MGNKHSKVIDDDDPYKILNVSYSATKKEIREAYKLLVIKHHPDSCEEPDCNKFYAIRTAYKILTEQTHKRPQIILNLDLYTENYFKNNNNFIESVDTLFKTIVEAEKIENVNIPVFTGNSKKFYDFFKAFKTKIKFLPDREENKAKQKLYNEQIHKILKIVAKYDERLKFTIENLGIGNYEVKKKIRVKKEKLDFFCSCCEKGFKSKSTYEVHLKSKKHAKNQNETSNNNEINNDLDTQVKNDYERHNDSKTEKEDKNSTLKIEFDEKEKINLNNEKDCLNDEHQPIVDNIGSLAKKVENIKLTTKNKNIKTKKAAKKGDGINREPIHFLKCSICGIVLESRIILINHLREKHN